MSMLFKTVALIGTGLLGLSAFLVSRQPEAFVIERSLAIDANSTDVFAVMSNFEKFKDWSPWQKHDPNSKQTIVGPAATVGSSLSWKGNSKVGEGSMVFTEIDPGRTCEVEIKFVTPFKATNQVVWTVVDQPQGCLVTWTMTGRRQGMIKAVSAVLNLDKMLAKDFDEGLANLKRLVESNPGETPA